MQSEAVFKQKVLELDMPLRKVTVAEYNNAVRELEYYVNKNKDKEAFIVTLCCGISGYLPTEKAEKAGHYSAYVSSGNVGHEGGDILTRNTIHEINDMF